MTENNYDRAIDILSSIELDKIIQDFSNTNRCREIKQVIRYYQDLSETQLITIRDLLRVMLTLKSQAPAQRKSIMATALFYFFKTFNQKSPAKQGSCERKICEVNTAIANMDSRWPARRLEYAAQIIVNALKEKKENKFSHGGMSRQEVQDAARLHIGDTGLLDYVLKSMNNVIVGSNIVCRAVNPSTRGIHDS